MLGTSIVYIFILCNSQIMDENHINVVDCETSEKKIKLYGIIIPSRCLLMLTMTPLQFQNNEENMEGEGDSDEINLDNDETLFVVFPESSSSKRKKSKNVSNSRSTKSKTSFYEEKFPRVFTSIAFFTKKQKREDFMFPTSDDVKMEFLKMHSDDSNSSDDNEECWVEEDREFEMLCGLALKGIILACNIRRPWHTRKKSRKQRLVYTYCESYNHANMTGDLLDVSSGVVRLQNLSPQACPPNYS
uniref:Uncharacterized protein n=1 Tax=Lactuca sativa TaxID=4236 RepID=A0A9R1W1L3_LACSA|nr:hypothetical protein LSAT_V11C300145320 [Lactuca sativa]